MWDKSHIKKAMRCSFYTSWPFYMTFVPYKSGTTYFSTVICSLYCFVVQDTENYESWLLLICNPSTRNPRFHKSWIHVLLVHESKIYVSGTVLHSSPEARKILDSCMSNK